jgi:hypothetical protein
VKAKAVRRQFVHSGLSLAAAALAASLFAASAAAVPPALLSVTQQERHPLATFSAPKADFATIYIATKPDRATDGSFLSENIKTLDLLTDSEIQAGRWLDEDQLDPGSYWTMMRASPDFDLCYIFDLGTFDPSCADGYSNIVPLSVPKPAVRYAAKVEALRYIRIAYLTLVAKPLGEAQPYRVCYRMKNRALRCVRGTLDGYSWDSSASDLLRISTTALPAVTTFTWYVGTAKVAAKRVRVR